MRKLNLEDTSVPTKPLVTRDQAAAQAAAHKLIVTE